MTSNFKIKPWRSNKYLAWVKTLPCFVCGSDGGDSHHLIGIGCMGGVGTTAPDSMTIPMCRGCHTEMHRDSSLHQYQWEEICRTLGRAI